MLATVLAAPTAAATLDSALPAATGTASYGWLLIALPMLGAAILLLAGKASNR